MLSIILIAGVIVLVFTYLFCKGLGDKDAEEDK